MQQQKTVTPISFKDALHALEMEKKQKPEEMTEVLLYGNMPPIDRLDNSLARLVSCQKLSLSSNVIDRIVHINNLVNLKILSLGRNLIKNLSNLESLANTLEELWISYNFIEKLRPLTSLTKLKILYIAYNQIKDPFEVSVLGEIKTLEDLALYGNPYHEKLKGKAVSAAEEYQYRSDVKKRIRHLKRLDGIVFDDDDDDDEVGGGPVNESIKA
ncbi:hypothetical protein GJ496_000099 [Pomphorhynchus laevis]|nr:hypothetical protein GJ496_000099 [Pomphorhynchus laevis]